MSLGANFLQWAVNTFGHIATDRQERAVRFLEEAIELAQTEGVSEGTVNRVTMLVFSRPKGDLAQEIGQASATLEMLAANLGYQAIAEADREFRRVQDFPKLHWQKRHAAKVELGIAK